MSFLNFFTDVKQSEENAAVIFDRDEPIGQATDLVMPRKRWLRRRKRTNSATVSAHSMSVPNEQ